MIALARCVWTPLWSEQIARSDLFASPAGVRRWDAPNKTIALAIWGGAQRWVCSTNDASAIRAQVAKVGGRAILFRHGDSATPVFHPLDRVRERLLHGIKQTFDPVGILNPGLQYATV